MAFAATAEDMMTSDPITIEAGATVERAARTIAERKHNRLPVIEHGRLVGVVTRLDVLDALTARPTG
jgi:CBS domain-containing protein